MPQRNEGASMSRVKADICAACGRAPKADSKFCSGCGAKV
jgi:hypothetical protein